MPNPDPSALFWLDYKTAAHRPGNKQTASPEPTLPTLLLPSLGEDGFVAKTMTYLKLSSELMTEMNQVHWLRATLH